MFWHVSFDCTFHINFYNFYHKQHFSELSSWWDNDLTHHISLHQPLCVTLLEENQHWQCMALIAWSWYPQCVVWNLFAVQFHQKRYDTAASCMQMECWWHLWLIANTTFSHKSLASNQIMHGQIHQLHLFLNYMQQERRVAEYFFPFPFIHFFALPMDCTPYTLLPVVTTELSFHLTSPMLASLLKSKKPLSFSFIFFDINQRLLYCPIISHCASCPESLGCEVTY